MRKINSISSNLLLISAATFVLCGCSGYTTDELLNTDFLVKDLTPVELIAPTGKSVNTKNPGFSWSKRNGVSRYLVEVSTSSDFQSPVLSKYVRDTSYTASSADGLDAVSYYWRIVADYGRQKVPSEAIFFHVVDDTIVYVNGAVTSTEQVGNKALPFQSIQTAIENAYIRRNGVATVAMNVQITGGTYSEEIQLREGVSLKGGFDPVTWSRNTTAYETILTNTVKGGETITPQLTWSTVVDGFTFNPTGLNVIYLYAASPTISNNKINGGSYPIYNSYGSNGLIRDNIINGTPVGTSSLAYAIQNLASDPTITNNVIYMRTTSTSTTGIYNSNGANPTITNNTISMCSGCSASSSIAINNSASSPIIRNNWIHGGSGSPSYGIYNVTSATAVITNNIIFGGQGPDSAGIYETNAASAVITNNVVIGGSGGHSGYSTDGLLAGTNSHPTITNNIFISNSSNRNVVREGFASSDFLSLENNVFWDIYVAGTNRVFRDENATNINTIAGIEALTDWTGGADKARGNILLPSGIAGSPFVNVPDFWAGTSQNNTGSASILRIPDGTCAGKYTNGEYIEWNADGIARQITCNSATNPDELTITPALSSASLNKSGIEIRYWGTKSLGGSQYVIDYHLQQNTLPAQTWNNLRYGGKDTSGNNCGGPGATGPGTQSCGSVTTDKDGNARTTTNAGLANNNTVPNGSGGATAAVPGGFSIGPYESD